MLGVLSQEKERLMCTCQAWEISEMRVFPGLGLGNKGKS